MLPYRAARLGKDGQHDECLHDAFLLPMTLVVTFSSASTFAAYDLWTGESSSCKTGGEVTSWTLHCRESESGAPWALVDGECSESASNHSLTFRHSHPFLAHPPCTAAIASTRVDALLAWGAPTGLCVA